MCLFFFVVVRWSALAVAGSAASQRSLSTKPRLWNRGWGVLVLRRLTALPPPPIPAPRTAVVWLNDTATRCRLHPARVLGYHAHPTTSSALGRLSARCLLTHLVSIGRINLYPRGELFLTQLPGKVKVGARATVAMTQEDMNLHIRRGEAVRVGDLWFRVSSEARSLAFVIGP